MKRNETLALILGTILAFCGTIAAADDTNPPTQQTVPAAPTPTATDVTPVNQPKLWIDTPYFKGNIPFSQVEVVSLMDFIHAQPLVGAETPLVLVTRIQFTAGAVTSIQGKGSPIFGAHLSIPNPAPMLVFLNDLKVGGFGGRNFNEGWWMAGLKIGKQLW